LIDHDLEILEERSVGRNKTRKDKINPNSRPKIKPKFKEERTGQIYQITAKTENQQKFLTALKTKQLIVGEGWAGVGKSFLSCVHAANQYLEGEKSRIVLLRPYVQVGKSAGLIPGTLKEKLWPLMLPMLDTLELVLGKEKFQYMIEKDAICIEAVENVRGRSYRDSIVIVDESQNINRKEVNALVTRLEETSQLILIGDSRQSDLHDKDSGIKFLGELIRRLKKDKPDYLDSNDFDTLIHKTACITFTEEDIVRSGLTKLFCKVFDNEKDQPNEK
jgi:phosphate starvation-inducible PhoH-like protein